MCQDCYTELSKPEGIDAVVECPGCQAWKVPINIDSIIERK
jgi:hypothetical protein